YQRITTMASAVLIPAALVVAIFSLPILQLATGRPAIAAAFAPVLAIRALGNAVSGLQYLPHTLQLAAGVSVAALLLNILNVSIYFPGMIYFTPVYGVIVPAVLWLGVMILQMPLMIYITHRLVVINEGCSWSMESLFKPALISFVLVAASSY